MGTPCHCHLEEHYGPSRNQERLQQAIEKVAEAVTKGPRGRGRGGNRVAALLRDLSLLAINEAHVTGDLAEVNTALIEAFQCLAAGEGGSLISPPRPVPSHRRLPRQTAKSSVCHTSIRANWACGYP